MKDGKRDAKQGALVQVLALTGCEQENHSKHILKSVES